MKKVLLVLAVVFLSLGLAACKKNGEDYTFDEQLSAPINLTISDQVLYWSAVPQAKEYVVYINGEKAKVVKSPSYNFAKEKGGRLIFTVVAVAPKGMRDSVHSTSIAYIANREAEIAVILQILTQKDFPEHVRLPFAEELVNKGMVSSEFTRAFDALEAFNENMGEPESPMDIYQQVHQLVGDVVQVEALVSGFIKVLAPELIDQAVADIDNDIEWYEYLMEIDPWWGYSYSQRIAELEEQKATLIALKTEITESGDVVVRGAMVVVEYFLSIEKMITTDLITKITNVSEIDNPNQINVNELVLIKTEIANILKETMPKQSDVVALINTLSLMSSYFEDQGVAIDFDKIYPEKMAVSLLLTFEAYIAFIDHFDANFFNEFKGYVTGNDPDEIQQAKTAILLITYIESYLKDNSELIDRINNVYTAAEKEAAFNDYLESMSEMMEEFNLLPEFASIFTFNTLLTLEGVFEDAFYAILDKFVEREGALLMTIAEQQLYETNFNRLDYWEQDYDEHFYYDDFYQALIMNEVAHLVNAAYQTISYEEFDTLREAIVEFAVFGFMSSIIGEADNNFSNTINTFFNNTSNDLYLLSRGLVQHLAENDVLLAYANAYEARFKNHYQDIFAEHVDFKLVFILKEFHQYMTTETYGHIDSIIDELEDFFMLDIFEGQIPWDATDRLQSALDYIKTTKAEIMGFNPGSLTQAQKNRLHVILEDIEDILND
ncbi:MAG: hypothetical protein WC225_01695 [Acholeplasmataceae bacterium]|nr:hypothetical protein [Acholeplasmataceae bacterium]